MTSPWKMQASRIRAPAAKAVLTLGACLVFASIGLAAGVGGETVHDSSPTRRKAARCLGALSRGTARAVSVGAPPGAASAFRVFARAPRASDRLPHSVRLSESLGALDAVTVNRARTQGGHPEIASAACLPLRSLGMYAEFLPRIDDALGREYALAPDSVAAVTFVFSGRRRRTVAARDNLVELPRPVRFTTGPRAPTLTTFASHLATLLPAKIIVPDATYDRPSGLVIELSRRLLAEDRLLALAGVGGPNTWSL